MTAKKKIDRIRHEYGKKELLETEIQTNPFRQFEAWFNETLSANIADANAMTVSTVSKEGRPSGRILLLKDFDERGFCFFTNYNSRKAKDIESNPMGSLVFFWAELERQIRIEGRIEKIEAQKSDDYFYARPIGSRIAAAVSPQSHHLKNRSELDKMVLDFSNQHPENFKRPNYWGGYRLIPDVFEFWQGRKNRLNDRIEYRLVNKTWKLNRLAP